MKNMINNLISTVKNRKGEMLIESVCSMLLFAILLLAVTTMIQSSLQITARSTQNATTRQERLNEVIMESYATDPAATPTSTLTLKDTVTGIDVDIKVFYESTNGLISFAAPTAAPPAGGP